jgi:aminoglycoside phosphotransferase (APT) family kinase protein
MDQGGDVTPEEGLTAWFADERGREVKIENLSQSTAGARRRNLLFDAVSDDGVEALVATALPTADIELVDVGTEAAVRELAADAGVATPRIRGVCTDTKYLGGPFFLSERLDGETIPRRVLRQAERTGNGETVVRELGTALARLHSIDAAKAPEKLIRPPNDDPIAVTLARLRELMGELLQPEPAFSYGLRWLEDHKPDEPARCSIVHGDARNGNLIVSETGLVGILDWEGAHIGDPMDDVAWPCTRMWRFGEDDKTVGGLARVPVLRDGYESAGGTWDDDRFRWWRALGTLRWGLGLAGQAAQHLDGRYRSIVMAGSGRRVSELAYDLLLLVRP